MMKMACKVLCMCMFVFQCIQSLVSLSRSLSSVQKSIGKLDNDDDAPNVFQIIRDEKCANCVNIKCNM